MEPDGPILLILDLDETLVYANEEPLGRGHVTPSSRVLPMDSSPNISIARRMRPSSMA